MQLHIMGDKQTLELSNACGFLILQLGSCLGSCCCRKGRCHARPALCLHHQPSFFLHSFLLLGFCSNSKPTKHTCLDMMASVLALMRTAPTAYQLGLTVCTSASTGPTYVQAVAKQLLCPCEPSFMSNVYLKSACWTAEDMTKGKFHQVAKSAAQQLTCFTLSA